MPTTTEDSDRDMNKRLANLFRSNPEFSRDYFANPPASDQSPKGKNDYARHQEAIAHVATMLQQEESGRQYRAGLGYQEGASRIGIEREIREAQDHPSFGDAQHPGHRMTMDRIGYLYRQLSDSK